MNPELRKCDSCPIKSASLSLYENVAGVKLKLCQPCLQRRDITKYRPAFVAERIRSKEAQV